MVRVRNIDAQLHGNGNLIAAARRAGKSLSRPDRQIILRARAKAHELGLAQHSINALEMEGERGQRGYAAMPIDTVFIGLQEMQLFGWKMRLYNIEGDHPLNNSTVSTRTLVGLGLLPLDISLPAVAWECFKEFTFHADCLIRYDLPDRLRAKFGRRS